ncbi:galectin-7-like [Ursus americanus]|uniref:galectin-7-like n=1 Tax=Ursus americanus TaxID=9643 RepID=UPI001E67AAEC|nr:galectin-7-like [Ursus americanus]
MNNKQAKVPYKLMLAEPGIFNAQDHRGDNEFPFIHLTYFQKEGENVPHKTSLPEGIRVGTVMRIRGVVPDKAGRFYVNLLCSEVPGSEAALHFNPRLDESTVVFNTLEQGAWGREERGSGIPFQHGQPFDVLLIATEEGFKAVVGDSEYHHFRYRIPPARVRLLEVGGDLQLDSVKIF